MEYVDGNLTLSMTETSSGGAASDTAMTSTSSKTFTSVSDIMTTSLTDLASTVLDGILNATLPSTGAAHNTSGDHHLTSASLTTTATTAAATTTTPATETSGTTAWTTYAPSHGVDSTMTSLEPTFRSLPVPIHVAPTHRIDSTFTGWITGSQNLSRLHGNYNLYVLYATFGLMVFCFLVLVCWVQCKKRLMLLRYERLPATEDRDPNFVYKPSHGGLLDEEYENTFVGVSIPILQDVTKL